MMDGISVTELTPTPFVWGESYSSGNSQLDHEHSMLMDIVEDMNQLLVENQQPHGRFDVVDLGSFAEFRPHQEMLIDLFTELFKSLQYLFFHQQKYLKVHADDISDVNKVLDCNRKLIEYFEEIHDDLTQKKKVIVIQEAQQNTRQETQQNTRQETQQNTNQETQWNTTNQKNQKPKVRRKFQKTENKKDRTNSVFLTSLDVAATESSQKKKKSNEPSYSRKPKLLNFGFIRQSSIILKRQVKDEFRKLRAEPKAQKQADVDISSIKAAIFQYIIRNSKVVKEHLDKITFECAVSPIPSPISDSQEGGSLNSGYSHCAEPSPRVGENELLKHQQEIRRSRLFIPLPQPACLPYPLHHPYSEEATSLSQVEKRRRQRMERAAGRSMLWGPFRQEMVHSESQFTPSAATKVVMKEYEPAETESDDIATLCLHTDVKKKVEVGIRERQFEKVAEEPGPANNLIPQAKIKIPADIQTSSNKNILPNGIPNLITFLGPAAAPLSLPAGTNPLVTLPLPNLSCAQSFSPASPYLKHQDSIYPVVVDHKMEWFGGMDRDCHNRRQNARSKYGSHNVGIGSSEFVLEFATNHPDDANQAKLFHESTIIMSPVMSNRVLQTSVYRTTSAALMVSDFSAYQGISKLSGSALKRALVTTPMPPTQLQSKLKRATFASVLINPFVPGMPMVCGSAILSELTLFDPWDLVDRSLAFLLGDLLDHQTEELERIERFMESMCKPSTAGSCFFLVQKVFLSRKDGSCFTAFATFCPVRARSRLRALCLLVDVVQLKGGRPLLVDTNEPTHVEAFQNAAVRFIKKGKAQKQLFPSQ